MVWVQAASLRALAVLALAMPKRGALPPRRELRAAAARRLRGAALTAGLGKLIKALAQSPPPPTTRTLRADNRVLTAFLVWLTGKSFYSWVCRFVPASNRRMRIRVLRLRNNA